jgi:hypothetical protein
MSENFNLDSYSFEPYKCLNSTIKSFELAELACVLDIQSFSAVKDAIITIISSDEIVNIKLEINLENSQHPLSAKAPVRIKNVAGK